ncbi:acyltransferase family protein [Oryzihumus sp.]
MTSATVTDTEIAARPRRRPQARFRKDIEGLRAVAVILVVAFHAGIGFVGGGFVGVDVFFVLSGFLITGLLVDEVGRTGSISLRGFYARRVRRLLPLSTLVLVATAIASFLLVPPIDRKGIAGDLVGAALWGANWRFAAASTQYMADTDKSPVLHYWSLSVEEQFYVVWPLLLLLLVYTLRYSKRRAPFATRRRVAVTLGVVTTGSFVASWQLTAAGSPFAYFGLHTRAWELGIGAALALARPVLGLLTRRAALAGSLVGLGMVVGSALLMDETTPFPGTAAVVPVLGAALLVAAGARVPDEGISKLLSHPVPRYIGRVSYAWYLWHWPVLILVNDRWGQTAAADGTSAPHASGPVVLAAVVASFGLAVASHYIVEEPARHAAWFQRSRARSLQLGGGLVSVSLVSAALLVSSTSLASNEGGASSLAASARADTPTNSACHAGFNGSEVPPASECRVGSGHGKLTIAVIGDSHMQEWRPALDRAVKERGWTYYYFGKSSCDVSDVPVWVAQQKSRYRTCDEWRNKMLDRVASIKGLDAIVIGRWMDYRTLALKPDGSRVDVASIEDVWRAGSARSFARLRKAAPRIVVLRDTPRPMSDVPACLSRNGGSAADACSFDRRTRTHLDAPLVAAEKAAAPAAVRFADMTSVLCPTDRCPVTTPQNVVIYRDGHHITARYSELVWREFSDAVERAIQGP